MEKIIEKLSNHESRLESLEDYQKEQNGTMNRINKKLDKLIWAIGGGMFAILLLLVKILVDLAG
jgi:hypothetical protein